MRLGGYFSLSASASGPAKTHVRSAGKSTFQSLAPGVQAGVKAGLLFALKQEQVKHVRLKTCHSIAEVAASAAGPGCASWPELLPSIFELAQGSSSSPGSREVALKLFKSVVDYAGSEAVAPHSEQLLAVLSALLGEGSAGAAGSGAVRTAALYATCAMIGALEEAAQLDAFKSTVGPMLAVLQAAFAEGEEGAQEVLQALIELVECRPHFFRNHLDAACHAMLSIISHQQLQQA